MNINTEQVLSDIPVVIERLEDLSEHGRQICESKCDPETLFNFMKEAFKFQPETHDELMEKARLKEAMIHSSAKKIDNDVAEG